MVSDAKRRPQQDTLQLSQLEGQGECGGIGVSEFSGHGNGPLKGPSVMRGVGPSGHNLDTLITGSHEVAPKMGLEEVAQVSDQLVEASSFHLFEEVNKDLSVLQPLTSDRGVPNPKLVTKIGKASLRSVERVTRLAPQLRVVATREEGSQQLEPRPLAESSEKIDEGIEDSHSSGFARSNTNCQIGELAGFSFNDVAEGHSQGTIPGDSTLVK